MKKVIIFIVLSLLISVLFGRVLFSEDIVNEIKNESDLLELDYRLILAIAEVESDFRWNVIGGSGEVGPFQIKKDTFMWLRSKVVKLYNQSTLSQNNFVYFHMTDTRLSKTIHIKSVCLFIRWLLDQENGNLELALQRYNGSFRKIDYAKDVLKEYEIIKKELN
jgi:soluble lytic murein transglycosylase-like protein